MKGNESEPSIPTRTLARLKSLKKQAIQKHKYAGLFGLVQLK
ncbi:uncharacterized protein CTRU02_215536 [Colletotrichum truncatum]|uniref:Uncharacterized protein n=1 Tax=Colletotrichum truncatum TaxID=5467 RepID=A0ACC3YCW6_COLTU|nr:uncharacterized protein CTRU02_05520 [Colletotrichum truncatum]KAF6793963.1 hypothetical protein CTRU02_05520 [Colletotrichum truncatum]